ncbi:MULTISPECIES: helix-turn-helix domain-containing protein [Roseivirga]|uniref:HTH cro/C1-type domain-containing protein n=1 Tax=Roseivirga spongicola TaxID=333140 RepID=A0A150XFM5_9BACT|nr:MULTISPECIES: helix-turn-helix transcriptional regulator [Roseivirga]KYG77521.1 hypothetical protein AWW68_01755 [Roseivirga spongicola]MBO6661679.1 helix-turn-helix transcriptional regulator [Roseivirga sp.]MBO6759912.1 helix-turn-helix transcriptional regulator [Roseivirga sp.]MBO6908336.1 helix-turn-helix transcriptional regulator [Roseivirga sp.]WPZ11232.1 helix-turn-helix transcriptional regulator [Roseivirga spongicola]
MKEEETIETTLKAIGDRLKQLREAGGFEGGYVGFAIHHVNMQPKQYWKLEAGTANFTIKTLLRVLDVHKITLEDFFKGT